MECTYHPGAETVLRCSKCERPICGRCVVQTPVGGRCKGCARVQRLPQYRVSRSYLLRALGAATVAGLGTGAALGFAADLGLVPWALRWLFFPVGLGLAGYLVGAAVSAATNRKQGPVLQGIAAAGFLASAAVFTLLASGPVVGLYTIIGFVVGMALALNPFR